MSTKYQVVEQRLGMDLHNLIKFQLVNYCFVNDRHLSPNQLKTLTFLAEWGEMNISDFCKEISDMEIYSSEQTVRNFVLDCIKDGIIIRKGKGAKAKLIEITPLAELLCEGNIVIKMNIYTDGKAEES